MGMEIQAHLPLNDTGDQQADDGEHRQGGDPFGFLEPHGSDGRGVLDPPKPRFDRGRLVLVSLKTRLGKLLRRERGAEKIEGGEITGDSKHVADHRGPYDDTAGDGAVS